uniref:Uncharacterized protein LOC111112614 isoform X2 n=1 Tax=Crassostrea virginica TaxID=6565 RepID=A0A8B8BRG7_CRAVI|nr:uncharacterized protein LOC111112614 isoform X2 [Crassostrea virginica]
MLECRGKGCLVLVCLAIILRSNEHYGKVLAMGIVHRVRDCPRDEKEWQKASDRLNCTSGDSSTMNKYHCLPADNLTTLLEFCYTRTRTQVVEGQCMVFIERKHIVNNYDCSMFKEGCPNIWYFMDQMYRFPACFEIDPLLHCYKAEATCQPTTWNVSVLSDSSQSTFVNKTSTNLTTADRNNREIDPLPILLPLIGILGIAVIIAILAWKNKWRRKRFFGRKETGRPDGNDEELRAFEMRPIEISQPERDDEESRLLGLEVNEISQPERDDEESRLLGLEVNEISQPERDDEESRLLGLEVNDIDRLGIDYLIHNLPSDHRTFPMIAEKLKIPQEILYWSLKNREKFVRSMKVGNIRVFNGRAMVIGCARAGKTTLVKKIKGDKDLTTTSTSGIEIHSHTFKLNSDESTIIVSTDEEKEKGCLCLAPGMLEILEENTQETSFGVNVNVVPDQSNVISPREENHIVDKASSLPSSIESTLNSNNDEVVDDTDPAVNESDQLINNLTAAAYVSAGTDRSNATLEHNIDLNDCVPSVNRDNLKMLTLLDFAGHSAYYACHHIFFSPRAFFILVVDMTKDLSTVATEACRKEGLIYSNWTYADYIKYWLGSIHTYSSKVAPVILAFSHSEDNGADPEKALQYFRQICKCLPQNLLDHLDKRRIFSFQKQSEKNVEDFKECLAATVKSQSHWGERVPISWTKHEAVLKKLKESNNVVSFSDLLRYVSETNDRKRNKEEDLLNALIFFNDTGVILFRSEIKDIIILNVQWFVDAFKHIIFDEIHMEVMEDMRDFAEFQELNEHGLLSSKVLIVLWQNSNFYQHKNSLVNHMKHLDMLAELSKELWYVPCMNKQKYPWEILNNCNVSSRLCFLFEFLPFVIYHRLVVTCINKLGMTPWKISERMCIYHKVTVLSYKDHRVLIAICDNKERPHRNFPYSIEIQINVTKPREIDTRLTSKLKEDIFERLSVLTQGILSSEFYSYVGYRCRLETFGKNVESHIITEEEMSASEYDCLKCSHPHIVHVGSIRRFWKKDEAQTHLTVGSRTSSSHPFAATEEMTNLNRVSRLMLGPCTEQLRDLLRLYIPPASFPAVIQRKRSQLKRLTEPQRKLILPNSGVYSGNYDDMDISLLYILLRNVCGIQAHNKGWGNTPDSADISVSANIERLRLARNRCSHTTEGMSNVDFNQVWSEIRAAVVDLDKVLGIGNKYQEAVDFILNDTMDPVKDKHFRDQLLEQIKDINDIRKKFERIEGRTKKMMAN